ncbi:MAG: CDP-glycerol glycerophosphotransferase family protein [Atopobiaceae bacterium]|nr:CDP-glycerol glycerophosphotransferase family protein [Atopobiaceae bacterium]
MIGHPASLGSDAELVSVRTPRHEQIALAVRFFGEGPVVGVALQIDEGADDLRLELPWEESKSVRGCKLKIRINPDRALLAGTHWRLLLFTGLQNETLRAHTVHVPVKIVVRMMAGNLHCNLDRETIAFPDWSEGRLLHLTCRRRYPSDTMAFKLKELALYFASLPFAWYWRRRGPVLMYDHESRLVRDNAYYLFTYIMEHAPQHIRKHVFFIVDSSNPYAKQLDSYREQVLPLASSRHLLALATARGFVASQLGLHAYPWNPRPSVFRHLAPRKPLYFLQHGVTAIKQAHLSRAFCRQSSEDQVSNIKTFVTTSSREQALVVNYLGYSVSEAPILGFPRWDVLEDRSKPDAPVILYMPTWRPWLRDVSQTAFCESGYCASVCALLSDSHLHEVLEAHGARLIVYVHPILRHYEDSFGGNLPNCVQLVHNDELFLNDLIMQCSVLITDYSSVMWDALYLDKPVLLYQFDQERFLSPLPGEFSVGSYIDFDTEAPATVCCTVDECVTALKRCIESGFTLSDRHQQLAEPWFAFRDHDNCERIYAHLLESGWL